MLNPWSQLQPDDLALPGDLKVINQYNPGLVKDFQIHTEVLPIPFLGTPKTAEIYLLHLNPRFVEANRVQHENPDYREQNRKSLTFEARYPFLYLDPKLEWTAGYHYWYPRLAQYIHTLGREIGDEEHAQRVVAEKFMCVQYFPYRSNNYKAIPEQVPSQKYGFHLVEEALRQNKFIVVMRSWTLWKRQIPELENYPYLVQLSCPRNPRLSQSQMKENYRQVFEIVRS